MFDNSRRKFSRTNNRNAIGHLLENSTVTESGNQFSKLALGLVVLSLTIATFLVALDMTIVSVAIPRISAQFEALNDVGWYGSAYLLMVTALQPAAGKVYSLYPVKKIYLISVLVFEVGSVLCAVAPSSAIFITGRALAGIGAAGLIQGAFGTITKIVPLEKRPAYIGVVVSTFGISACASPVLGGALTDARGWEWCFWINLPIGALATILLAVFMRSSPNQPSVEPTRKYDRLRKLDPLGICFLVPGVCCLLLALQWGGCNDLWSSAKIIGLLSGFVVLISVFSFIQWRLGGDAMLPAHVFRQRTVLFGSLTLFAINFSSTVKLYYTPFFFQIIQGDSPEQSGVRFIAIALPQVVATIAAGGIATATGHYMPLMVTGEVLCAIGTGLMTTLDNNTKMAQWVTYMTIAGFGDGLALNMPYVAIQALLKSEQDVYIGNGIATFASLAGGTLGIAIASSIYVNVLLESLHQAGLTFPLATLSTAGVSGSNSVIANQISSVQPKLIASFTRGFQATMVCATAAACLASIGLAGMRWCNLKTAAVVQRRASTGDHESSPKSTDIGDPEEEIEGEKASVKRQSDENTSQNGQDAKNMSTDNVNV